MAAYQNFAIYKISVLIHTPQTTTHPSLKSLTEDYSVLTEEPIPTSRTSRITCALLDSVTQEGSLELELKMEELVFGMLAKARLSENGKVETMLSPTMQDKESMERVVTLEE